MCLLTLIALCSRAKIEKGQMWKTSGNLIIKTVNSLFCLFQVNVVYKRSEVRDYTLLRLGPKWQMPKSWVLYIFCIYSKHFYYR